MLFPLNYTMVTLSNRSPLPPSGTLHNLSIDLKCRPSWKTIWAFFFYFVFFKFLFSDKDVLYYSICQFQKSDLIFNLMTAEDKNFTFNNLVISPFIHAPDKDFTTLPKWFVYQALLPWGIWHPPQYVKPVMQWHGNTGFVNLRTI